MHSYFNRSRLSKATANWNYVACHCNGPTFWLIQTSNDHILPLRTWTALEVSNKPDWKGSDEALSQNRGGSQTPYGNWESPDINLTRVPFSRALGKDTEALQNLKRLPESKVKMIDYSVLNSFRNRIHFLNYHSNRKILIGSKLGETRKEVGRERPSGWKWVLSRGW